MKYSIVLFTLFVGSLTWAEVGPWNGTWQGEGVLRFQNGQQENCQLQMEIESSSEIFFVKQSLFQCKTMRIKSRNPQALQIRKAYPVSELWMGSLRLGTYSLSEIHTRLEGSDGRTQSYDLLLVGEVPVLNYHDYVFWTASTSTEIHGQLHRIRAQF